MIAATPAHAAALTAIHAAAFPAAPWDGPAFASLLSQPGVFGFIAQAPAGLILLRAAADEAEILTIAAAEQRRGAGRALLAAGIAAARSRGCAKIFLEVAAANTAARALYAGASFTQAGTRPHYYEDGSDALILVYESKEAATFL